jgi:hypothetical protein
MFKIKLYKERGDHKLKASQVKAIMKLVKSAKKVIQYPDYMEYEIDV